MALRVISGELRGLALFSVKGDSVRPTSAYLRESIFNIISGDLPGAKFLDLYSGTGAVAIEAVSRGARHATLVENSATSVQAIIRNVEKTKKEQNFTLVKSDVAKFLHKTKDCYDIIFIDPPYVNKDSNLLIETIINRHIINENGLILLEQNSKTQVPSMIQGFENYRKKNHSASTVHFYRQLSENL
ncbi:MAG: 16S rRNA (guanine(966)-N(2))-methyltransferase RsmD [Eubacteriaceae bacterium]|nr:16S rRNA (guanine(966)-N(2))-methyltransferase RsmD [Eubacteriaceae bacterium]